MKEKEQILKIRDLDISFKTTSGYVHAIRGVNIDLMKGETVAVVGESGSGKSVTMKAAMGILAKNATVGSGSIEFSYHHEDGTAETVDILKKDKKWIRRHINGKRIAMVFQDPMTSLDPTMTIGKQIMEGMIWHYKTSKSEAYQKAVKLLELVGITDAEKRMKNYPHQLSGGMRQRVVIAIALACDPDLLICDEPTTALDVTIQAKILELIKEIQAKTGISVIYITHDLGVVAKVADFVNVMYAGKIVERGTIDEIFYDPRLLEEKGVPTHFVEELSDTDAVVKKVQIVPLEVIIRNISAGSFAARYGVEEGIVFEAPTIEFSYKCDELNDPLMNSYHAIALKLATPQEIETIKAMAFQVNDVLKAFWQSVGVTLVDFKLEFGRLPDGTIILADEISPDTARLWDSKTGEKLDKDRFRRDLGGVEDAYQEVLRRVLGK